MPLFLASCRSITDAEFRAAMRLAALRYPEVAVLGRYTARVEVVEHWVCEAPSETHVRRWASAAEVVLDELLGVDAQPIDHRAPDTG